MPGVLTQIKKSTGTYMGIRSRDCEIPSPAHPLPHPLPRQWSLNVEQSRLPALCQWVQLSCEYQSHQGQSGWLHAVVSPPLAPFASAHTHTHKHTHGHTNTHTRTRTHTHTHTHTDTDTHTHTDTHTDTRTHTQIHTRTHTHTDTQTQSGKVSYRFHSQHCVEYTLSQSLVDRQTALLKTHALTILACSFIRATSGSSLLRL